MTNQSADVNLSDTSWRFIPDSSASVCGRLRTTVLLILLTLLLCTNVVLAEDIQKTEPQLTQSDNVRRMGYGILSELRLGVMAHDVGIFGRKEEDGVNVNVELLFNSPELLSTIWSPRFHAGFSINSSDSTNQTYIGLTWSWDFLDKMFAEASLGGAVHDGETLTIRNDRKSLGCKVLLRESVAVGYSISKAHSVSVMLDHISNAKLCKSNEGLDSLGMRYGYRF